MTPSDSIGAQLRQAFEKWASVVRQPTAELPAPDLLGAIAAEITRIENEIGEVTPEQLETELAQLEQEARSLRDTLEQAAVKGQAQLQAEIKQFEKGTAKTAREQKKFEAAHKTLLGLREKAQANLERWQQARQAVQELEEKIKAVNEQIEQLEERETELTAAIQAWLKPARLRKLRGECLTLAQQTRALWRELQTHTPALPAAKESHD